MFGTYELKRANENQILFLKTQVDRFQVFANDPVNRYEVKAIPGKEPHSKSFENLPNEKLGYFVIEHENVQLDRVFPLVVGLAKVDLTVVLQGNYLGLITNGNESDFDNDLQIIGNNTENTGRFLRLILKMVLKDAIYNPKFISDLKKD